MFSGLERYTDAGFLLGHDYINFDTLYQTGRWQVFGVMYCAADMSTSSAMPVGFSLSPALHGKDEVAEFINIIRQNSLFSCNVPVTADDSLLLLTTPLSKNPAVRLVVAARLITEASPADPLVVSVNPSAYNPSASATTSATVGTVFSMGTDPSETTDTDTSADSLVGSSSSESSVPADSTSATTKTTGTTSSVTSATTATSSSSTEETGSVTEETTKTGN